MIPVITLEGVGYVIPKGMLVDYVPMGNGEWCFIERVSSTSRT